jgi:uridine kinase
MGLIMIRDNSAYNGDAAKRYHSNWPRRRAVETDAHLLTPAAQRDTSAADMATVPVVIGVAGGSGSGKTTVVRRIVESLPDNRVTVLDHDRYYRDRSDLRLEERAALNYDHPDALETDLLVTHVRELREGRAVRVPVYDFALYARKAATEAVEPRSAVIVEGILIYTDARLRDLMDIKVFVDADADTRFIRRLRRDVSERGRTMDSVIDQYLNTVKPMHLEFVEPSKRYADIIIPIGGHNPVAIDMMLSVIRSLTGRSTTQG